MSGPGAILETKDLTVHFPGRRRLFRRMPAVQAVSSVSLTVTRGTTTGLVGESGSGKSTFGRALVGLSPVTSGQVLFDGTDLGTLDSGALRRERHRMHLVFQDPYSSLDPSMLVRDLVAEPIDIVGGVDRATRDESVLHALERVGLGRHHLDRYPAEFSGGQRQRIAIARAIVSKAEFIVCDEAVSALDVSTQGQVVNLLERLQEELGLSLLFIAHDLSVVRHISDRIAVMYLGEIVEEGPAEQVYTAPAHPYTASLLSAIPRAHPDEQKRPSAVVNAELPSPTAPPSGCRFRTRCLYAHDRCAEEAPEPTATVDGGFARCHLHDSGPTLGGQTVLGLEPPSTETKSPLPLPIRS